jgi:hypothetical protein
MVNHLISLHASMVFPLLALADYAAGYRKLIPIKICDTCHGQYIKAAAQDLVPKHTCSKSCATMAQHADNASTLTTTAVVALGFPNV